MTPIELSFGIATAATVVATTIGVAVGAALARPFRGRDLLDVAATAPLVLPPTVLGYYVLVVLGRGSAIGGAYEAAFGRPIVFTREGAVLAATLGATPIVVKSARAAFESIDPSYVAAARTLGASATRAFVTVSLPLATRPLVAAATLAFARSLGDFGVTLMIAGDIPGETRTAALAIYAAVDGGRDREAGILSLTLAGAACALLYAANKLVAGRTR